MISSNFLTPTKLALIAVFLVGCAGGSRDIYYWNRYEDSLYEMYLQPGNQSLTDEILRLEEDMDKAKASGQPLPPGFHAHLAFLYSQDGDYNAALAHFQLEKEKFPESADFIDGIVERMKK